jgi:predicted membrane protein
MRWHAQARSSEEFAALEMRLTNCLLRNYEVKERGKNMPLINLVIPLIIVGFALWLINRFIPMASSIKTILNVVVVVGVCVWLLQVAGLWGPISTYRI